VTVGCLAALALAGGAASAQPAPVQPAPGDEVEPDPGDAAGEEPPATGESAGDDEAKGDEAKGDEAKGDEAKGDDDKEDKKDKGEKDKKDNDGPDIEITGRVFFRATAYDDDLNPWIGTLTTPSARLGARYRWKKKLTARISFEARGSLRDAYVEVRLAKALHLRAGRFKLPVSAIERTSTWTLPTIGFLRPFFRSHIPSGLVADTTLTRSPVFTPIFLASPVWMMIAFSGMRSVRYGIVIVRDLVCRTSRWVMRWRG
jgi:hypothetical protein